MTESPNEKVEYYLWHYAKSYNPVEDSINSPLITKLESKSSFNKEQIQDFQNVLDDPDHILLQLTYKRTDPNKLKKLIEEIKEYKFA